MKLRRRHVDHTVGLDVAQRFVERFEDRRAIQLVFFHLFRRDFVTHLDKTGIFHIGRLLHRTQPGIAHAADANLNDFHEWMTFSVNQR